MNKQLVALVTGASSGIGKAIAKQLLVDGFIVYAAARRLDKMADLEQLGARAIVMDITQATDIDRLMAKINTEQGGVDVLVNNAGFGSFGAVEDTPIDEARYQFEVNLFGLARVTQAVLPYMRSQQSGKIVNITSMGGKIYTPLGAWYHATKHALEGWSDCLRVELAPFGIDVIIIEPGIIETEFSQTMVDLMMQRSGHSAYSVMAKQMEAATHKSYNGGGSPPELIAQTVAQALKSKRPKTRYAIGKLAKSSIFSRKLLSDRLFDRIVLSWI